MKDKTGLIENNNQQKDIYIENSLNQLELDFPKDNIICYCLIFF